MVRRPMRSMLHGSRFTVVSSQCLGVHAVSDMGRSRCEQDTKERSCQDAEPYRGTSGRRGELRRCLGRFPSAALPRKSHSHLCLSLPTPYLVSFSQNQVRKALHPDYYPPQKVVNGFDHIDHCLNSIRESLQCSSDITPNTWIWNEEKQMAAPRLDNMHMCRNFDKIREWAQARELTAPWNKTVHVEDDLEYAIIY